MKYFWLKNGLEINETKCRTFIQKQNPAQFNNFELFWLCKNSFLFLSEPVLNLQTPFGTQILPFFLFSTLIGVGPVPWLMISEVFAPNIRAHGAAFSSSSSWLMAFVVTKLFQPMEGIIGSHGAFWLFAVVSIVGAVLAQIFLPETKGKTLQEIQIMLNKK